MEEKYVLVSLEDERTGKLASVLGNKTCKKILDLLAEKELSESEISKELKMPLNTVGYNIKNLILAGLIEEKRHLFSIKGKRVPYYKISNKHIIISPKKTSFSKLKTSLPVVIIAGIFTGFILWFNNIKQGFVQDFEKVAAPTLADAEEQAVNTASSFHSGTVGYFLIIMWVLIAIFIIFTIVRRSK